MDVQQIIAALNLQPHPKEGGYFVESFRSEGRLLAEVLPEGFSTPRALSTAIYYLLTPATYSEMHRLPGDEIFHFYMGDPVEMLQLWPDGTGKVVELGTDLESGQRPQVVVPGEVWQGSRLKQGGSYALLGTTMSPGFDYEDYESGQRTKTAISSKGGETYKRVEK
ncbi:MAG TPA: cupin domain-containing protein, partial [Chloroflexota bacterium]|nr:cupin domain-containing protein [Chloroflexota bacterium]